MSRRRGRGRAPARFARVPLLASRWRPIMEAWQHREPAALSSDRQQTQTDRAAEEQQWRSVWADQRRRGR